QEDLAQLVNLSGGSPGFALKIIHTGTLPLYVELLDLLNDAPALDMTRLHKLADQIGRKADAESFDVVTALLVEHVRRAAHGRAAQNGNPLLAERALQLWDRVRGTFAAADSAHLDRKLVFVNTVTDIVRTAA